MAESNTQPASSGIKTESIISELGRYASRMRYLAMAADCINNGNAPVGIERDNCVDYLMDTIEVLGAIAEGKAQAVIDAIEKLQWSEKRSQA